MCTYRKMILFTYAIGEFFGKTTHKAVLLYSLYHSHTQSMVVNKGFGLKFCNQALLDCWTYNFVICLLWSPRSVIGSWVIYFTVYNHKASLKYKTCFNHKAGLKYKTSFNHKSGLKYKTSFNHKSGLKYKTSYKKQRYILEHLLYLKLVQYPHTCTVKGHNCLPTCDVALWNSAFPHFHKKLQWKLMGAISHNLQGWKSKLKIKKYIIKY